MVIYLIPFQILYWNTIINCQCNTTSQEYAEMHFEYDFYNGNNHILTATSHFILETVLYSLTKNLPRNQDFHDNLTRRAQNFPLHPPKAIVVQRWGYHSTVQVHLKRNHQLIYKKMMTAMNSRLLQRTT